MTNATITNLHTLPWTFALRISSVDSDTFREFLVAMKEAIPHRACKWSPDTKQWLFTYDCIGTIEALLRQHGLTYQFDDDQAGHHRAASAADRTTRSGTAVYRTLAKMSHPDWRCCDDLR